MISVPIKTRFLVHGSLALWTGTEPGTETFMYYDCGAYMLGVVLTPNAVITCLGCAARVRYHG